MATASCWTCQTFKRCVGKGVSDCHSRTYATLRASIQLKTDPSSSKSHDKLKLFAYGTYEDYLGEQPPSKQKEMRGSCMDKPRLNAMEISARISSVN